jgi:hypothetical protein
MHVGDRMEMKSTIFGWLVGNLAAPRRVVCPFFGRAEKRGNRGDCVKKRGKIQLEKKTTFLALP